MYEMKYTAIKTMLTIVYLENYNLHFALLTCVCGEKRIWEGRKRSFTEETLGNQETMEKSTKHWKKAGRYGKQVLKMNDSNNIANS